MYLMVTLQAVPEDSQPQEDLATSDPASAVVVSRDHRHLFENLGFVHFL